MDHYHAAIWIDHAGARVYSLGRGKADEWTVRPHERHVHLHHKANSIGSGKAPEDKHYFDSVAEAVADAGEIVVTGPGSAKDEFVTELKARHPRIAAKVVAVKSLDHPTDGEFVNFARQFFHAVDRMRPL